MDETLQTLAAECGRLLLAQGGRLGAAESCTGGWLAKVVTDLPGSSAWFECGLVTYSNESKQALLGVPAGVLVTHGAVSLPTVRAMAAGVLGRTRATHAVAISGIAGPGGGSPDKPVGTVCFAWADADGRSEERQTRLPGDREAVRRAAVEIALRGVLGLLIA